jgi:hypothetical protein
MTDLIAVSPCVRVLVKPSPLMPASMYRMTPGNPPLVGGVERILHVLVDWNVQNKAFDAPDAQLT